MEYLQNPQALFIVITVFILFINKVVDMMKEKQAEKAAREDRRELREQRTQTTQRSIPPARQQTPPPIQREPQQPQTAPASPFQDVLTELFEAAGVPVKPQQEQRGTPPPSERKPPPIPGVPSRQRVQAPVLTREERDALDRLERRGEKSIANRNRNRQAAATKLTHLLLSKDAARQAIVAAEILGPPRGMKEMDQL
ncbi:MAG: hypothetical protein ACI9R3_003685 [Verrucomicrobiales bacterium]|jgi:hypothetical protein